MDPITPIYHDGMAIGIAVVSVMLFVWTKIEATLFRKSLENVSLITHKSLEMLLKLTDHAAGLELALQQLVRDQQVSSQRLLENQTEMMANQRALTEGTQKFLSELLSIIREVRD